MAKNMTPKKNDKSMLIFFGAIAFLVTILIGLHSATYASIKGDGNLILSILGGIGHLTDNPLSFSLSKFTIKYIAICLGILAFAGLWLYINEEMNRRNAWNIIGGTADWSNPETFKKQFTNTKNPFDNIILSQDVAMSMESFVTRRNNNVLVVGGSGSGKTRFMIKPNILQANCSFVVTDPKGEILETEGEMLKKHGYKIKVFNLTDMKHSNSYNPFEYIRDDLGVLMLINCLIKNTNNGQKGGDPFWEKSETALLQALIFYLVKSKTLSKDCKNFTNVMKLLQAAEVNENDPNAQSPLDQLFNKLEAEDPNSIAVKQYKTFKMGAGKTLKSILISAGVRLTTFNMQEIEDLTMQDDLELASIGDEKTALFVVIPAADDTYNFLVSMMYSQLFETLYYRAENECPYEYYIKSGSDVLAISRKAKTDNITKRNAEQMLSALKRAGIRERRTNGIKKYIISVKGCNKEFYTREAASNFKKQLDSAEIVKGSIRLPYRVRFLLDEFANIGQIPDFTKKLATMRQYEISCTIILQNLAQIKTMYKDDWESIVGNCDSFLFLGGQEQSTLEYISKTLGKATVTSRSSGRSRSGKGGNSSLNFQKQGRELMTIDELATMPKTDCILLINGLHPFYGKKFDLVKHPHFDESGDSKKGSKFDCKKEIMNYGLYKRQKEEKMNAEIDPRTFVGESKTVKEVFKENNIKSTDDAVKRIVIKKGEVVINETENKETGVTDWDYNVI